MEHPDDREFWAKYFQIVSPGRLHIFEPGQIYSLALHLGFHSTNQTISRSLGTVNGSLLHLTSSSIQQARQIFASAPDYIVRRYEILPLANGDYSYAQRWEFLTMSVDVPESV